MTDPAAPPHAVAARGPSSGAKRVLLTGASGTIGRATAAALVAAGHEALCLVRGDRPGRDAGSLARLLPGATVRVGDPTRSESILADAIRGERVDALISCLASRNGSPREAWAVEHDAQAQALAAARTAGVPHFVLLSAICVQKPRLVFQHAKLAFERELQASGLRHSIVRPTAFFKSLSGQFERVRAGKPYLMFGDGRLTACKPIADADLAAYLVGCLDDPARWNRVLPIGGPGPALTPREMGESLFRALGRAPRFQAVPAALLGAVAGALGLAGRIGGGFVPALADKAEFARIGHYYATESMLVWDEAAGRYDAGATPETGRFTLPGYYAELAAGRARLERGEHAVF